MESGHIAMRKMTIYLPSELRRRLENFARKTGKSEAAVIRDAISRVTLDVGERTPRVPLTKFGLGDPTIAGNVDELLDGFGR